MRADLIVKHRQRGSDSHVHIKVLVGAQAPAEQHVLLTLSKIAVLQQLLTVHGGVHRVIGLVSLIGEA